ncbi:hypothetical protein [Nocardiopsis halotolerans]|uniref:hypothetical protein n=1 Tax=Nocardiopsis halotolerans TaxID=124252 RepID=UPI00068855E0|nr:hypothetical protein [Nocardiopsis halotolerans]
MPEEWRSIDRLILDGQNIQAIQAIREKFGHLRLHEAVDLLETRFEHLHDSRPDDSTVSSEGHRGNLHSYVLDEAGDQPPTQPNSTVEQGASA